MSGSKLFGTLTGLLKQFFEILNFEKISRIQQKNENLPSKQRVYEESVFTNVAIYSLINTLGAL